ncbi:hypothetical protein Lser_V15G33747 [Lactuca serriola]
MDRGIDAYNLLLVKTIPVKQGYVGVVNCCQESVWFVALEALNAFIRCCEQGDLAPTGAIIPFSGIKLYFLLNNQVA